MKSKQQSAVYLPNPIPIVTLPCHMAKTLRCIIEAEGRGISTLGLVEAGCLNPAKVVSAIVKRGGLIGRELKDATDAQGAVHRRVAHYYYSGWRIDAIWPQIATATEKDRV